jgi:hypothetical protein
MTAIMESGDDLQYCLTHNEAMKLSSECTPKISRANAEKLLQSFTRKGWLVRPADSKVYCLSLRSLLELETYLKNEYPDQTETTCVVCDELVTVVRPPALWAQASIFVRRATNARFPTVNTAATRTAYGTGRGINRTPNVQAASRPFPLLL